MGMVPQQRMQLQLAPRMIQSMEILQLPIMALQERIQQELQENPVLELNETIPDEQSTLEEGGTALATETTEAADPGEKELTIDETGDNEADFDRLEALSRDWDDQFNEEHRVSSNSISDEGDKKHDAMQNMASRPQSLHDHLNEQLVLLDLEAEQLKLVRYLITHIAENGYLGRIDEAGRFYPTPMEELAKGYDQPITPEEFEDALAVVQRLEPPGIGARDLKECLLLQLTPDTPYRDVLRVLILNHMEDMEHNRLPAIQRKTGFDLQTIKAAIEVLRHLNLRPGAQFITDFAPHVTPDIKVFRLENGDYDVQLLDDWLPSVYISPRYRELYRDRGADPKAREYLKRKIQAAEWLLDSIQQRRNTLEKVTRAIIKHQKAFLDRGPEFIEPLKMQQIADLVGVHVTTVSRAVDDKWVETPRGLFPLKRFFGGGTQTTSGEDVAWETIKQKLLEVIGKEDKANPLSDEDLVRKLEETGYPIKRRTVTKYRKMLNIPSSRQRKDWTL